jgi:hypothetical protein
LDQNFLEYLEGVCVESLEDLPHFSRGIFPGQKYQVTQVYYTLRYQKSYFQHVPLFCFVYVYIWVVNAESAHVLTLLPW